MTDAKKPHTRWVSFFKRVESLARQSEGYAVINLTVLVDGNGEPVLWKEPDVQAFEPRISACHFLDTLLSSGSS